MEITASASEPVRPEPEEIWDEKEPDQSWQPPQGGLPLGVVLGAAITTLLALLLGSLTVTQLHREERAEVVARRALLTEVLVPIAAEIENAPNLGEIEALLSSAANAEINRGRTDFRLMLCDQDGQRKLSIPEGADASLPKDAVSTQLPVHSALFESGHGTLTVVQNDPWLAAEMAKRRRAAWLEIGGTMLAVGIVVQLMIYLLVSLPLNHLLTAIDKVEQGYPVKPRQGAIARELRWLEWRFHHLNASLNNSARLLVAAHRRAMDASRSRVKTGADPRLLDPLFLDSKEAPGGHEIMRRFLADRCAQLEACSPGDPQAQGIAHQAWERDAVQAEKLGDMELRIRIENSALKVLDPDVFARVDRELEKVVANLTEWCTATSARISSSLEADGVIPVAIQRRTKHVAGIWRKMQNKGLDIEDVADIVAFRIIVRCFDDCYLSLDTVHRLFAPEPFRFKDYIASPKVNGYQSIHTSVRDREGLVFEIQIRTVEMHRDAEQGNAAHWRYRAKKAISV